MNGIKKVSTTNFMPALIGLSIAWLGVKFIHSEKRLAERKIELEIQLATKNINFI